MGSISALGTIFPIFITPMTILKTIGATEKQVTLWCAADQSGPDKAQYDTTYAYTDNII